MQGCTVSTESKGGGRGCGNGGNSPCSVSASSDYEGTYPAEFAVDGLLDTFVHSTCDNADEWFLMDLESEHRIVSVKIIARTDFADRIEGLQIRVGNLLAWSDNHACATIRSGDDGIFVGCGAIGRYVFVVQPRSDTCLNFAEMEVLSLNIGSCAACAAGKHSAATARARACVRASLTHRCNKHASGFTSRREVARTYHAARRALMDRHIQGGGRQRPMPTLPRWQVLCCCGRNFRRHLLRLRGRPVPGRGRGHGVRQL